MYEKINVEWDFNEFLEKNKWSSDYWVEQFSNRDCQTAYLSWLKKRAKDNKRYRYLVTFTLDPKKNELNEELYKLVEDYIISLAGSIQYCPIHWAFVREYTKAGVAHWHVSIVSKTIVKQSYFKYYITKYGNVDVSTSRKNEEEYSLNYMAKDSLYTEIIKK